LSADSAGKGAQVKIMVMDGQGGGIGALLIKGLREAVGEDLEIWALGTNATATARMMKAGANRGATGENAIARTSSRADIIIGSVSILMAHAMMGEVSPAREDPHPPDPGAGDHSRPDRRTLAPPGTTGGFIGEGALFPCVNRPHIC